MEASEKDTKLGAVDPHHSTTGDEQEDTPSGSQEDDAETKAGKKRKRAPSISSEGDAASSLNERWEEMFGRLKAFRERYGHCNVPNRYPEDPQLGFWVSTQRRSYRVLTSGGSTSSALTVQRAQKLINLGFEWSAKDPRMVPWQTRFDQLKEFVNKHGHAQVPIGWQENVPLSNWVSKQRQEYKLLQKGKASRLTQERMDLLSSVGFVWEAKRGAPRQLLSTSGSVGGSDQEDAVTGAGRSPGHEQKSQSAQMPRSSEPGSYQKAAAAAPPSPPYGNASPRHHSFDRGDSTGASLHGTKLVTLPPPPPPPPPPQPYYSWTPPPPQQQAAMPPPGWSGYQFGGDMPLHSAYHGGYPTVARVSSYPPLPYPPYPTMPHTFQHYEGYPPNYSFPSSPSAASQWLPYRPGRDVSPMYSTEVAASSQHRRGGGHETHFPPQQHIEQAPGSLPHPPTEHRDPDNRGYFHYGYDPYAAPHPPHGDNDGRRDIH